MKRWKKLLVSLLTVSMTIGASTMSVMAANGYTYKVTLSAGNKGTINGQAKVERDSVVAGSTVTFNLKDVQVTDDKYYIKGIRLSGRDNEEALASPVLEQCNRRCRLCSSLWNQKGHGCLHRKLSGCFR